MNEISSGKKYVSYCLKIIVIISAFVGTFLSVRANIKTFMGGTQVFMFFTTQSNILVALICAVGCVMLFLGKKINSVMHIIKLVGTVSITLTGVVFVVLLAPTLGPQAWNIQNVLTHVIVPIAAIADFFVISSGAEIKKRNVIYVIIPPLLYAIYAGIGFAEGWQFAPGYNYPYFFLNWGSPAGAFGFTNGLPFMGCAWWILALLIFLIIIGFVYIKIAELIGKKSKKSV